MSYQVTARKWRPMVFEDVVGQSHITSTLRNAIATNRLAHAYIFSGQRGCGKTTTARILAKAINCLSPRENNPDNTCEVCQEITAGRSLDVIEIDGASNRGVEEIRNLRESVRYIPTRGRYKVYIIDEVHMLTKEAFNALLKTLEEPPVHVIFVFATTEVHKVPPTILSRCQRFDFRRIAVDEIIDRLRFIAREEGVSIDDDALMIIARKGDGSMRDAQSIFDQIRSFCGNTIASADVLKVLNAVDQEMYFRVTDLVKTQDVRGGIELVEEIVRSGYDMREFLGGLAEHLRNLLVAQTTGSTQLVEASEPYRRRYEADAKHFEQNDLLRLIRLAGDLEQSIRWSSQPRFKLEAGLLQMIKLDRSVQIDALLRQIDELKKKLNATLRGANGGAAATASGPVQPPVGERSPAGVKVVGQVSAGRLKSVASLAPASYSAPAFSQVLPSSVSEPAIDLMVPGVAADSPGRKSLESAGYPSVESRLEERSGTISAHEAYEQWQRWVGEVRKSKISLGTMLSESRLLDISSGMLRIGCPDDFHLASLRRHREFLVESFERVSGKRLLIEPVLQRSKPDVLSVEEISSGESGAPAPVVRRSQDSAGEHPIVVALRRELGAEPVE